MRPNLTNIFKVRCFSCLCLIASVAAGKAILFPIWPSVEYINPVPVTSSLQSSGFETLALKPLPASQSYDFASTPVIGFKLNNDMELWITNSKVRQREDFRLDFINQNHNKLSIVDSRQANEFNTPTLRGKIGERHVLQTCLLKDTKQDFRFEIEHLALLSAVDQYQSRALNRANQILGVEPSRSYNCYLITLISHHSSTPQEATWISILNSIGPALDDQAR